MKEIGFVGLGAMGSAMAPLLSKADFNVYGYDIKKPKDRTETVSYTHLTLPTKRIV